jgi:serine/threonine protein phosphatase PrpC
MKKFPDEMKNLKSFDDDSFIKQLCYDFDNKVLKHLGDKVITASGSTLCMLLIQPLNNETYKVKTVNVGDSKGIAFKGDDILFKTAIHVPTDAKEKERINKNGGTVKNGRVDGQLALSRAFGDPEYKLENMTEIIVDTSSDESDNSVDSVSSFDRAQNKFKKVAFSSPEKKVIPEPDIENYICEKGTTIIMGSDGIFTPHITDSKIFKFTKFLKDKNIDDQEIPSLLSLMSENNNNSRGIKCDNTTVLLICLDKSSNVKEFESLYIPDADSLNVPEDTTIEDETDRKDNQNDKKQKVLNDIIKNASVYNINVEQLQLLIEQENVDKYHQKLAEKFDHLMKEYNEINDSTCQDMKCC